MIILADYVTTTSEQSRTTALVLCLLLGWLGAHNFYVGRIGKGFLYLFTGGLFLIGVLVDLISILTGSFRDSAGAPMRKW